MAVTLQQLRSQQLELKIEKGEIAARLTEIKATLEHKHPGEEVRDLNREKAELAADQTSVDSELIALNARVTLAEQADRERDQRLNHIRQIACAALAGGYDQDDVVWLAKQINDDIEALIPVPLHES